MAEKKDTFGEVLGTAQEINKGIQLIDKVTSLGTKAGGSAAEVAFQAAYMQAMKDGLTTTAATKLGEQAAANTGASTAQIASQVLKWAAVAYEAHQTLQNDQLTDSQKAKLLAKQAGLVVADTFLAIWTGGYYGIASAAYGGASQFKEFREFEETMEPFDPVMQSAESLGQVWGGDGEWDDHLNLLTGGMDAVVRNTLGIRGSKNTKEYQQERLGEIWRNAAEDIDKLDIAEMARLKEGADPNNILPSGREWKFEEQEPIATAQDARNWHAFRQAFPDWMSGFTEEERVMIINAALDRDLLMSEKGNVIASGKHGQLAELQDIGRQVKEGTYVPLKTEEQRHMERQEILRQRQEASGEDNPLLGMTYEEHVRFERTKKAVAILEGNKARGQEPNAEATAWLAEEHARRQAEGPTGRWAKAQTPDTRQDEAGNHIQMTPEEIAVRNQARDEEIRRREVEEGIPNPQNAITDVAAINPSTQANQDAFAREMERARANIESQGLVPEEAARLLREEEIRLRERYNQPPPPPPTAAPAPPAGGVPGGAPGVAPQTGGAPTGGTNPQSPDQAGKVTGSLLWKPVSESNGNLVILFPYAAGTVTIKDAATGQVLDTGTSTGPSNGYADTVRFNAPGASFQNVTLEDSAGNTFTIQDGSQRIEDLQGSGFASTISQLPGGNITPVAAPDFGDIKYPKFLQGGRPKRRELGFQVSDAPKQQLPNQPDPKSVGDFKAVLGEIAQTNQGR
jgi:hypothetical protein